MKIPLGPLLIIFGLSGCTSLQLQRNTLAQGRTWTEMQYGMILDNLAMFRQAPGALPWHLQISQGSTSVTDAVTPTFSYLWPNVGRTLGLSGGRTLQDNWTVVPISDDRQLRKVKAIYEENCRADWLHAGVGPRGCFSGHFRSTYVWVAPNDLGRLTKVALDVLAATKPQPGKPAAGEPVLLPGPITPLTPP